MSAAKGQAQLLQNVKARVLASLNGKWQFIIDPLEHGYRDYRGAKQQEEGYFKDRKPTARTDRLEYDFDAAETLDVPGDWNSQRTDLLWYEGAVWYRRRFDADLGAHQRLFLHFAAANYQARVFLNGQELGLHVGGFTPFQFEVTPLVRATDNSVVVLVDNRRRAEGVPALGMDWWNFGGLTREVFLIGTPETFIRDYLLQLDDQGNLSGFVQLDGSRLQQRIQVTIAEARLELVTHTDQEGLAHIELPGAVKRWSPNCPKLYDVVFQCETDTIRDHIGFRRIDTSGHQVLLNGEPLFLRGISLHEQAPFHPARAHSVDDAQTLLGWATDLGANCVRLAHYPHNEHIVRLADALGLLVWAEVPVYWTLQWKNPDTLANAITQLTELITRDKNRAAVVIWSVGNETPISESRNHFMRALVDTVRQLDPSRLVSAALEANYADSTTLTISDPLGADLDVIGCNEYIGWYDGLPDKADSIVWQCDHEKPVFISEFGADALQGHHGDPLTRWTEEYQVNVYQHQLAMLDKIPFLCGMSPWILTDFRSPRRPLPGVLDYYNRKGLISDRGVKKQAFHLLRARYTNCKDCADTKWRTLPSWDNWLAVDRATLVFVFRGEDVLLIRKLRGLGAGKVNGPGGRIEQGETPIACAKREVQEELCVTPKNLVQRGELRFQFVDGYSIHGFVFVADDCIGEPTATEEAEPLWTHRAALPYDQMWADDRLWLPHLVAGRQFRGRFLFAGDFMLKHDVLLEESSVC